MYHYSQKFNHFTKNIYDVVIFKIISNKAEIPYCEEMEHKVTVIGKASLNHLIRLLSCPL